jgi:hypothetical protein
MAGTTSGGALKYAGLFPCLMQNTNKSYGNKGSAARNPRQQGQADQRLGHEHRSRQPKK